MNGEKTYIHLTYSKLNFAKTHIITINIQTALTTPMIGGIKSREYRRGYLP